MGILKTLTINGTTYNVTAAVPAANVTLLASAWKSDGEAYSQVVDIPGVTAHTKVDLQPTSEQLVDFHSKDLAFVAENDGGTVTVFAIGDKPAGDHTIQITKTEVDGAGKIRGNTVGTTLKPAIEYIDGSDATPPLVLMDLEPGSYVLNGTFAYSSNPENGQYPFVNTLVQIDEIDVEEKSVRFQVADEIVCIFFTYDSYEFKRYNLNDIGSSTITVELLPNGMASLNATEIYQKLSDGVGVQVNYDGKIFNISSCDEVSAYFTAMYDDPSADCIIVYDGGTYEVHSQQFVSYDTFSTTVGNVEEALDSIIAIQESLIGGAAE